MGVCAKLATSIPVGGVGLFSFVLAVLQVLTLGLILCWLWRQRVLAESGRDRSAQHLILPVYSWILWMFAVACILQAMADILIPQTVENLGDSESDADHNRTLFFRSVPTLAISVAFPAYSPYDHELIN